MKVVFYTTEEGGEWKVHKGPELDFANYKKLFGPDVTFLTYRGYLYDATLRKLRGTRPDGREYYYKLIKELT